MATEVSPTDATVEHRARALAALADPARLSIIDALVLGDASPGELGVEMGLTSNLLAHHLGVLERAGLVSRHRSQADRRRSYLRLVPGALDRLLPGHGTDASRTAAGSPVTRVVFVCTADVRTFPASRGTVDPAQQRARHRRRHPPRRSPRSRRLAAANRHGLPLTQTTPRLLPELAEDDYRGHRVRQRLRGPRSTTARSRRPHTACTGRSPTRCRSAPRRRSRTPTPTSRDGSSPWPATSPQPTPNPAADPPSRPDPWSSPMPDSSDSPQPRLNPRPEHEITLDQQVALRSSAARLAEEFTGTFNAETIEKFLASSYDEFAGRSTVVNYLPLLAERFARERLHALSRVEGLANDGRAAVLFLCTHNSGRSQMAMGFFAHHAGEAGIAWSGGSEPGIEVNPAAVAAMAERGIDISREYPKPWTDEVVRAADAVISMGCGTPVPSSRASATRTGTSTTPTVAALRRSGPSATTSNAVYWRSWTSSASPRPPRRRRRHPDRSLMARHHLTPRGRAHDLGPTSRR